MPDIDRVTERGWFGIATSVRNTNNGAPIFKDREWRSRPHVHIGGNSERKTRNGRTVRYLELYGDPALNQVRTVRRIQEEDRDRGFQG